MTSFEDIAKVLGKEFVNEEYITYLKNCSTEEYFKGNQFSIDAFIRKYAGYEGETYSQAVVRVCDFIASVEDTEEKRRYWSERWQREIFLDWWQPAGSIMQGAGINRNISLANCNTISLGALRDNEEWDSLEAIIRNTGYTVAKSAAYRQGIGVDFSRIRPAHSKVNNSAKLSQGPIHWMKWIDQIGYFVGQLGRVPAMLESLNVKHPDIIEFIKCKADHNSIQNANISVHLTEDFYLCLEKDNDWVMEFSIPEVKKGDRVYIDSMTALSSAQKDEDGRYYYIAPRSRAEEKIVRTEKARYILELIAQYMTTTAEPGIQNIDLARKWSNSDYLYDPNSVYDCRIISTNACSEQYLPHLGVCILSSINAGRFSTSKYQLENELSIIGQSINRFLDNVNECEIVYNLYANEIQKIGIQQMRRTGAGYTNLVEWLFRLGVAYGTPRGIEESDYFTERYNYWLYRSSIELGKEKGSFGAFNREKLEKAPFIQHMMELGLEFEALRNVCNSSLAPTGSLSLMFRDTVMSYGIEPAFGLYYWKRTRISGKYEYYFCVPHIVREAFHKADMTLPIDSDTIKDTWNGEYGAPVAAFIDKNLSKLGVNFKSQQDVSAMEKLELMGAVMKNIDSSISTTYMLPEGTPWQYVYEFILHAHKKGVKSIAAFPDKKMYGIVTHIPFKKLAKKLLAEGINIHSQNFSEEEAKELNLSTTDDDAPTDLREHHAPKRPANLVCDIHHLGVEGKKWTALVGLYNGKPYEVFGGLSENADIPKRVVKGEIIKRKCKEPNAKGRFTCYDLVYHDNDKYHTIEDIAVTFDSASYADLTRLLSMSLRHGVPINFIIEQLGRNMEASIVSFTKVMARTLKKYLPIDEATGEPREMDGCRSGNCN